MAVRIFVDSIMQRLGVLQARLPDAMLVAVKADVADGVRYSILNYLSGQRLRRRTGNLQRNVAASPKVEPARIDSPTLITGVIGTSLRYGKAHEEGFHGTVQVRAHTRRKIAIRRNSRGTITKRSASRFKRVLIRGGGNVVYVRSHKMRMNITAKRYIRDALRAVQPNLRRYAGASLRVLGRTGKVPTVTDLRGGVS